MVLEDVQACQTDKGVYYAIFLGESEMIGVLAVVPKEVDDTVVEAYIELLMINPATSPEKNRWICPESSRSQHQKQNRRLSGFDFCPDKQSGRDSILAE